MTTQDVRDAVRLFLIGYTASFAFFFSVLSFMYGPIQW